MAWVLSLNPSTALAVVFFILPLLIKRKQTADLSTLIKCALAAMTLPDLAIILFYLITNRTSAIDLQDVAQLLTVMVLVFGYVAITEIKGALKKKENDKAATTPTNQS